MKALGKIRTGQKNKNSFPNNPNSPTPTHFKPKALPMLIIAFALFLFLAPKVNAEMGMASTTIINDLRTAENEMNQWAAGDNLRQISNGIALAQQQGALTGSLADFVKANAKEHSIRVLGAAKRLTEADGTKSSREIRAENIIGNFRWIGSALDSQQLQFNQLPPDLSSTWMQLDGELNGLSAEAGRGKAGVPEQAAEKLRRVGEAVERFNNQVNNLNEYNLQNDVNSLAGSYGEIRNAVNDLISAANTAYAQPSILDQLWDGMAGLAGAAESTVRNVLGMAKSPKPPAGTDSLYSGATNAPTGSQPTAEKLYHTHLFIVSQKPGMAPGYDLTTSTPGKMAQIIDGKVIFDLDDFGPTMVTIGTITETTTGKTVVGQYKRGNAYLFEADAPENTRLYCFKDGARPREWNVKNDPGGIMCIMFPKDSKAVVDEIALGSPILLQFIPRVVGGAPTPAGNRLSCTFTHKRESIVSNAPEAKFTLELKPDGTGTTTIDQKHKLDFGSGGSPKSLQIAGKVDCTGPGSARYEAKPLYQSIDVPKTGDTLTYGLKCDANIKSKGGIPWSDGWMEAPKLKCTFEKVRLEAKAAMSQAAPAGSNEITFDVENGFTITGVDEERGCTASKDEKAKTVKLSCTKPIIATVLYTGVGFKIKNEAGLIKLLESPASNGQCFDLKMEKDTVPGKSKQEPGELDVVMLSNPTEDCLNPKTTEFGFNPKSMTARIGVGAATDGTLYQNLKFGKLEIELAPKYDYRADEYAIVTSPGDNAEVMVRGREGSAFEEPAVVINNMQLRAVYSLPDGLEKAKRHKTYGGGLGNDYLFGTIKLTHKTDVEIRLTSLGGTELTLKEGEYGVAKIKTHQAKGLGTAYENNGAITSGEQLGEGWRYNTKKENDDRIGQVSKNLESTYGKYFGKIDPATKEKLAWPLPVFMPVREAGEKGGIKLYEFQYQRDGKVKAAEYKAKGLGAGFPYEKYDAGTKTYKIQNWPNGKDELNLFNINKRGLAFDGNEKVFNKLAEAFKSTKVPREIEGMDLGEKDAVKVKPVFLRLEADGKGGALLKHKVGPGDTGKPAPDVVSGDKNIEEKIKSLEKEIAESGDVWEGIDATKKITESKSAAPAEKKASKLKKGELAVDLEYVAGEKGSAGKLYVYLIDLKSAQTGAKAEKPDDSKPKPPERRTRQAVAKPYSEIRFAGTEGAEKKAPDYAEMKKNFAALDSLAAKMVGYYLYSGTKAPDGVVLRGDSKNTLNVKIPAPEKTGGEMTVKCELSEVAVKDAEKLPAQKTYKFEGQLDAKGTGTVEQKDVLKEVKFFFSSQKVGKIHQLVVNGKVSCKLTEPGEEKGGSTGASEKPAETTATADAIYENREFAPTPSGNKLTCSVSCEFKGKTINGKCALDCTTDAMSSEALKGCITTELYGPNRQNHAKVSELTGSTGIRYIIKKGAGCKSVLPTATALFEKVEVTLEAGNDKIVKTLDKAVAPWFMTEGEWTAPIGKSGGAYPTRTLGLAVAPKSETTQEGTSRWYEVSDGTTTLTVDPTKPLKITVTPTLLGKGGALEPKTVVISVGTTGKAKPAAGNGEKPGEKKEGKPETKPPAGAAKPAESGSGQPAEKAQKQDPAPGKPCNVNGVKGTCISVTSCKTKGNEAYRNFCPQYSSSQIQCCVAKGAVKATPAKVPGTETPTPKTITNKQPAQTVHNNENKPVVKPATKYNGKLKVLTSCYTSFATCKILKTAGRCTWKTSENRCVSNKGSGKGWRVTVCNQRNYWCANYEKSADTCACP